MSDEPAVDLTVGGKDLGPYRPWYVDDFLGGTTLYSAARRSGRTICCCSTSGPMGTSRAT